MSMIQFRKCAYLNRDKSHKLGKNVYDDGIEALITIDPKSTLIFQFAGKGKNEDFKTYLKRIPEEIRNNWKAELERYLSGKDFCDGIPLQSLTWLSVGQVETLRSAGVYSVESLAKVSDGLLEPFGLDGSALRRQAKSWLEDKSGQAVARLEEQDFKIKSLEEQRNESMKVISQLQNEIQELKKKTTQTNLRK